MRISLHRRSSLFLAALLCGLAIETAASAVRAQAPAEQAASSNATIRWQRGPCEGQIGKVAQVDVPEEFQFAGAEGTAVWLQANNIRPSDKHVGVLLPSTLAERWFLVFSYDDSGYVSDADKNALQPGAVLQRLQAVTMAGSELRGKRGLPPLEVLDWAAPPVYDEKLHQLTWITHGTAGGQPSVNLGARLLGRNGVLAVSLVVAPGEIRSLLPTVRKLLSGVRFLPGQTYADWRKGDPASGRTLQMLITGETQASAPAVAATGSASPVAAPAPGAGPKPLSPESERLTNQVIIVLLAIAAIAIVLLIFRLLTRARPPRQP